MPTSLQKTSNTLRNNHQGFSLIEILVALVLAAMVFLVVPSGDTAQKHRELRTAVENINRAARFAGNESVLRNTVVRLRISLDKSPIEYTVEFGPAGNLPLPDMAANSTKSTLSLSEAKAEKDKSAELDKQFNKVEEFEEIKHAIHPDVTVIGMATSSQKKLMTAGEANIYFYPTGEKDAALIFFSTIEEMAYLEIEPFLSDAREVFQPLQGSVAKLEDILQTKMDEVFKEWIEK
jgi:prepilin-type N-terminal cleavage/methylation domain-containing protein